MRLHMIDDPWPTVYSSVYYVEQRVAAPMGKNRGRDHSRQSRRQKADGQNQRDERTPTLKRQSSEGEERERPEPGATQTVGKANGVVGNGADEVDSYVKKGKKKRIFRPKESILTYLCSTDKNVEAFYHVFIVMICTAIIYSLIKDSVEAGELYVDMAYYFSGFGPYHQQLLALLIWLPLQAAVLAVYPAFLLWEWLHRCGSWAASLPFILLLTLYNIFAHCATVYSIVTFDLPPVPALFLSIEQLRFTMKSYSFVRENAYKVLHPWHKDDESGPVMWYAGQMEPQVGSFSSYLYFLFSPTLLYRDRYPRTPRIRILRVLAHLTKCCISLTFVVSLCKEVFDSYPRIVSSQPTSFSREMFIFTFMTCCLWGLVLQFMAGYFFLHSWLNLWGEVLRFADREFYSDWWTCTSFSAFYRKWNLLVHDWIKAYIYQDLKDLFNSKFYNSIASLPTIIISAVFHEYVLWAPARFVLPLLLVQFGTFGSVLYFVRPTTRLWNYLLHIGLNIGVSTMVFVYATEFYSRKICPKEETLVNSFVPRFIECFWT